MNIILVHSHFQVLGNLYKCVGQTYYSFPSDRSAIRIDRRAGLPVQPHNTSLCQACSEGTCKFEWTFNMQGNPDR